MAVILNDPNNPFSVQFNTMIPVPGTSSYRDPNTGQLIQAPQLPKQTPITIPNVGQNRAIRVGGPAPDSLGPGPGGQQQGGMPRPSVRNLVDPASGEQVTVVSSTQETLVYSQVSHGPVQQIDPATGGPIAAENPIAFDTGQQYGPPLPSPEQRASRLAAAKNALKDAVAPAVDTLKQESSTVSNFYGNIGKQVYKTGVETLKRSVDNPMAAPRLETYLNPQQQIDDNWIIQRMAK